MLGAVVATLLGGLTSIVQSEVALLKNVEGDIQNISFLLATVKAVVRDAEIQRLSNDPAVEYFEQLRDIAYELEDILDEWRTEALRSEIKESQGSSSRKRKASNFLSPSSSWFSHVFSYHNIGNKIKTIMEKLEFISKVKEILSLEVNTEARERVEKKYREKIIKERETSSLVNTSLIVGREEDKEKLVKLLLREVSPDLNEVPVISIVGMGGVGKTTLAQIVYNDKEVKAHFEKRMWVCISDDFDVKRITISILKSANETDCESMELDQSQTRLSNILDDKVFLLVLDDIWSQDTESWDRLCLPFQSGAPGSRIIITTRSENVARAMRYTRMHKLGVLSCEDCWSLFHRRAFVQRTDEDRVLLEPIGREIVNKCGGVPLAAKTLGSAMSSKRTRREWQLVLESETWNSLVALQQGILPALLLSYCDLPSDIKQCFIYCSLFPKDWLIEKDEIVKLWVAQGFIHSDVSGEMEEIGGLYFDDLVSRSLLQEEKMRYVDCRTVGKVGCKMHDLVHDLARFISKDEYSIVVIGRQTPNLSKVRHSFIQPDVPNRSIPDVICNAEKLRTFYRPDHIYTAGSPRLSGGVVPDTLFHQLRCLRALGLKGCYITELSPAIGMLKHLRYLDLSDNPDLEKLPDTVSNLCNLQTLNLLRCRRVRELPNGMSQMTNLRHLEIQNTLSLRYLPQGIGRLKGLRTLSEFVVGDGDGKGCNLRELKYLNLLQGKLLIRELVNVSGSDEAREAELDKKEGLRKLTLVWNEWPERKLEENHSKKMDDIAKALRPPHTNLEELTVFGYQGSNFPKWMIDPLFINLVRVCLSGSPNCTQLPGLGKLSSLKYLEILEMDKVRHIGGEFCGSSSDVSFPKLEKLSFNKMPNWEDWELTSERRPMMPSLCHLGLYLCPKLNKLLPNSHLLSLKTLTLWLNNNELLSKGLLPTLPILNHLMIKCCHEERISIARGCLEQLKALEILEFAICNALSCLPEGLQSLTNLQTLRIDGCPKLNCLPEELQSLTNLQTLEIRSCRKLQHRCIEGGEEWHKISHIPNIIIKNW